MLGVGDWGLTLLDYCSLLRSMAGVATTFRGPSAASQRRKGLQVQIRLVRDLDALVREVCEVERRSVTSFVNMIVREFFKPHGK
jgi:hypothetical protein